METASGEDLGSGVFVSPAAAGELVVISRTLDLEWRVSTEALPGTAVIWRGHSFEVIARSSAGSGDRWTLRPWDEPDAMRGVSRLDSDTIERLSKAHEAACRAQRISRVGLVFLPLLGFAPAGLQKHWTDTWGHPATTATWVSALFGILLGAIGLVQSLLMVFGGGWFLPWGLRWLVFVGPLLVIDSIARLVLVASDGEPVGSVLGFPLRLVRLPQKEEAPLMTPEVRRFDEDAGVLELVSRIYRQDWTDGAVLRYRDRMFRLHRCRQEGRDWVYGFDRCTDAGSQPASIKLRVPPGSRQEVGGFQDAPPSIIETTLISAAMTVAPSDDQKIWGGHLDVRPIWFTILGAAAELVGGLVNLRSGGGSAGLLTTFINLFFVGEGLLRFVSVLGGRPIGSVLGWLLRPLYRRRLKARVQQ